MRLFIFSLFIVLLTSQIQSMVTKIIEFPESQRCSGRNVDKEKCCTNDEPCVEGEGDCENDDECREDLVCGNNNCKEFGSFYHEKDDCCIQKSVVDQNIETVIPLTETEPNPGNFHINKNLD